MIERRHTSTCTAGNISIGHNFPIVVQSMTKTQTPDVDGTIKQIQALTEAGCEIVRVAVPDMEAADAIEKIKSAIFIPLVADIHFKSELAIAAIRSGADGVRINPGNICRVDAVKEIISCARDYNSCVRIGINMGSLHIAEKNPEKRAKAIVNLTLKYLSICEDMDFFNTKVSLKSSSTLETIEINSLFAECTDYPIHIGLTEAGPPFWGGIKSASAISILLHMGIGDTIRVSLTGDPVREVYAAYTILRTLGLRNRGVDIISCPTCGRCQFDIKGMANEIAFALSPIEYPLKVAVMGCHVNGPGEAKEADIGVAMGQKYAIIFKEGMSLRKIAPEHAKRELLKEIKQLLRDRGCISSRLQALNC